MTENGHIDLAELRIKAAAIHTSRLAAIEELRRLVEDAADKERRFRKRKAIAFATARKPDGVTVTEAELQADEDSADARYERDVATGMVTAQREYLALLERDASTLRQVADWSQRLEGVMA